MKKWILGLAICLIASHVSANEIMNLDAIVIEASRSNSTLLDMNKDTDVLTSKDIAESSSRSLPQLLGTVPGVFGIQYGNIKNSQVDIHGFGETAFSNVLVLINGRRTNQIDLSGVDWAQIDKNAIERVEVIKGSGSVLYGDNASGGVINIVTKKGKKETKPTVELSTELGSYQTHNHALALSGGLRMLDYQFNYGHQETTGYRANSDYWANDFNTHLGFDPTDIFGIDFSQGYHLDRYQLPGALFLTNIQSFGRTGVRASLNNDHGWTSDSHFDVTPHLNFTAGTSDGEFSMFTSERKRSNKFFTDSTVYETMYLTNSYEFQPKVVLKTPLSDRVVNTATAGYDYFYAKNMRRSGFLAPGEDLVYIKKETHGVYLLDEVALDDHWLTNVGARGAWAQYNFDQKAAIAGKSKRSPTTEGFEGGLGYKYNANSKVYVNFARSYRLPAVDEFYQNIFDFGFGPGGGLNTALTYQVGNQYSWGIKDQTIKNTKLGLNFFVDQYKNEIYLDPNTFNNTNYNGRTRHYGVETEAAVELFDNHLEPFANLTVQKAQFRGGSYGGEEIPFTPDNIANAGLTWRPVERLNTTLSVQEVGERFAISDITNTHAKVKCYTTANWSTNYSLKNLDVWVSLDNLLNVKYYTYGVYSSFSNDIGYYPAPGRNITAGMKLHF